MAPLVGCVLFALLMKGDAAVPSPQSLGSDVTILTHNDLYGNASTRQAATLVLSAPRSHSEQQVACDALHETLWNPGNDTDFGFLQYLRYDNPSNDTGLHWIGGATCRTMNALGRIQSRDCNTRLPALCSQSAALSSPGNVDASAKWHTVVKTGNATIVGYRDKLSFRFLGLRYAPQPVRFEYSKYQAPRSNVSALAYGPQCFQSACGRSGASPCSEDCLSLNVWTPHLPDRSSKSKKAVMLWIHGGGFTSGEGSDTTFDGGNMASRGDVVMVTINYRLGTLGFLALNNSTLRGNYWLSDQIAALDWVQAHIEDFGGDKNRVTVFGQSAGGASVRALLASPLAKGKFSGAIMQSCPEGTGYASTFSHYFTISEAADLTKMLLNETNCARPDQSAQLACLRAPDPKTFVAGTVASYPVVDGTYLTSDELLLDGTGPVLDVAVMVGVMHDDGAPFSSFSKRSNASQALTDQGYDAAKILGSNKFPVPQGSNTTLNIFNLTSRVATDAEFRCLAQSTAFSAASNRVFASVYSYEIDRAFQLKEWNPNPPTCEAPITPDHPLGDPSQPYYKCHSGELYYEFGTIVRQGLHPRDEHDIAFSQYVLDSWTAFGRTKDPNPTISFLQARGFTNTSTVLGRTARWEAVEVSDPVLRVLDVDPTDEGFREVAQCEVLDFPLDYYST